MSEPPKKRLRQATLNFVTDSTKMPKETDKNKKKPSPKKVSPKNSKAAAKVIDLTENETKASNKSPEKEPSSKFDKNKSAKDTKYLLLSNDDKELLESYMDKGIRENARKAAEDRQKKTNEASGASTIVAAEEDDGDDTDVVPDTPVDSPTQQISEDDEKEVLPLQAGISISSTESGLSRGDSFSVGDTGGRSSLRQISQTDITSMGCPKSELKTTPGCLPSYPPLEGTPTHTVLFRLPYGYPGSPPPEPYPKKYWDKWDADHVRLPCSPENLYPIDLPDGTQKVEKRWELIEKSLTDSLESSYDIEEAILMYNSRYRGQWDFSGLHAYFNDVIEEEEKKVFFKDTLPKLVDLALQLPHICTQPIPLLKSRMNHSVTLSQKQVACLLANAFFCTFPRRNSLRKKSEYSNFPYINMATLFRGIRNGPCPRRLQKLHCIFNYFRRVLNEMPTGTITMERQCISARASPKWDSSSLPLRNLHISSDGNIEDNGIGLLQVDFANKFLGGGVLNRGCVQEEIRFLINPELMISMLVTEMLEEGESLIMTGGEQFSQYTGYADTFKWAGDYRDNTPRDPWGRRCVQVVAIDALVIHSYKAQFNRRNVTRELNKAYSGFKDPQGIPGDYLSAVATGNWGCGAFGGDKQLKALIQLMAAAAAERDMCYFTFDDDDLMKKLFDIHKFIKNKDLSIGDIFAQISMYYSNNCCFNKRSVTLYDYIMKSAGGYESGTTDDDSRTGEDSPDYQANTP